MPQTNGSSSPAEPSRSRLSRWYAFIYWKYRRAIALASIPVAVIICILLWNILPMQEASYQQKELAREFFNQCKLVFTDTSQIPKVPEEALNLAQRKKQVTLAALRNWGPIVRAEVREGYWYARIQFTGPEKKVYEQKIGVAVNDVGYNTPSESYGKDEKIESLDP